ncbi:2-oxo-4-hydroxy-4-carboxy-5-ureidoimidazoline decarboxylase [Paenibacillus thailandensis]|uniref:2-oxo-4-hydroxy-4-carboxy-5-ureidoimidazoline decarboxylase n=1 Tax=Paenibacillus thailandensis TaxID=393250 RepID=A0ABW5R1J3_9BACL
MTLDELNGMDRESFTEALGAIFEHSPWVARKAWERRPYSSREKLHGAMMDIVRSSPEDVVIGLFRAHPDLAARIRMADHSVREQQGAGLDRLSPDEFDWFAAVNRRYTEKFGFPFIMAVKGKNKDDIKAAMEERLLHNREEEAARALEEIGRITGFRLADLIP